MAGIIYVLGSTRSGTSAIRNALGETQYKGYGEGHLAPILVDMIATIRRHNSSGLGHDEPGNGLYKLRPFVLLRHLFHGYERYLVEEIGSEYIVDKTPTITPILAAPDLNKFHKNVKFIHCSRRHVDNIHSKLKKFPEKDIAHHTREWADTNAAWLDIRDELDENFVEFDFHQLATDPDSVAKLIGEYIGVDEDVIGKMAAYLHSQRPEAAPDRDLTKFLKLSEVDWSDEDKAVFTSIAEDVGERLGYGFEDYFA